MGYWSHVDEFMVDDITRDLVRISYESTKAQYESSQKKSIYERDYFSKVNPSNMAEYDEAPLNTIVKCLSCVSSKTNSIRCFGKLSTNGKKRQIMALGFTRIYSVSC